MNFARLSKNAVCILAATIASTAFAQDVPTFSAKVNVVSVLATVHDRDGKTVKDLKPDDFVLLEDGAPQKIRYFSHESDLPLTVGLLVDTSRSQEGVLEEERQASYRFLDQMLRAQKDQAFVAHFDTHLEILQGLTSSRPDLAAALNRLSIPGQFATLIYSAVHDTSEEVMRPQAGRKAVILLTDGVAFRDPLSMETAIEYAQRADTIIYAIRFAGPIHAYRPLRAAIRAAASAHGKEVLERMAGETGGGCYEVKKGRSIEEIYAEIEDALRNEYNIGFTPEQRNDGKYHKLKLTTKDRYLVVHARDGYYAK